MSNGVYYQSRASEVYGGTISLIIVAAVAVVLRLTARKISAANFWWDDWTLVVALICLAIQILYLSSAVAIKTSLILLYYRIFGLVRWFRWLLGLAWTIVLLYYVISLFIAIFECTPVTFYWDRTIKGGRCIDENQYYRWNGVANLLIDFMILCLTMPVVWRLKREIRQKIILSGIFLIGLFACVASIVRVTSFSEVNFNDITYTLIAPSIWTTIEQSLGITCACLLILRPLIVRLRELSTHSSSRMLDNDFSKHPIPLRNMGSRPKLNQGNVGEIRTGFARLPEDIENGFGNSPSTAPGEATVTTHVRTSPLGLQKERMMPEAIIRQQTLEQHHHSRTGEF